MFIIPVRKSNCHLFHPRSRGHILCVAGVLLCLLCLFCLIPAHCLAAEGDGSGGGTGENRGIPLTLTGSTITDGAKDVALNVTIELDFNKNVCSISDLPDNRRCFHLVDGDGDPVAFRLTFPDTQVQRDLRREVFLQPSEDLAAHTDYRVLIDSSLRAKNGTTLDRAWAIHFTTGDARTDAVNQKLARLGDYLITYDGTAPGESRDSSGTSVGAVSDTADPDPSGSSGDAASDAADPGTSGTSGDAVSDDGGSASPAASRDGLSPRQISIAAALLFLLIAAGFTVFILRVRRNGK